MFQIVQLRDFLRSSWHRSHGIRGPIDANFYKLEWEETALIPASLHHQFWRKRYFFFWNHGLRPLVHPGLHTTFDLDQKILTGGRWHILSSPTFAQWSWIHPESVAYLQSCKVFWFFFGGRFDSRLMNEIQWDSYFLTASVCSKGVLDQSWIGPKAVHF